MTYKDRLRSVFFFIQFRPIFNFFQLFKFCQFFINFVHLFNSSPILNFDLCPNLYFSPSFNCVQICNLCPRLNFVPIFILVQFSIFFQFFNFVHLFNLYQILNFDFCRHFYFSPIFNCVNFSI